MIDGVRPSYYIHRGSAGMWQLQCLYVWVRDCLHTQLNLVPLKRLCKTLASSRRLEQNYDIIGSVAFCAHQRMVKRSQSLRFLKKSKNSTLPPEVVGKRTFKNDTVWKDGCVPDLPHHKCPEPEVCPRVRYAPHGFFHLQSIKIACQRVFSTCFR